MLRARSEARRSSHGSPKTVTFQPDSFCVVVRELCPGPATLGDAPPPPAELAFAVRMEKPGSVRGHVEGAGSESASDSWRLLAVPAAMVAARTDGG